jgi:hypothetical protein
MIDQFQTFGRKPIDVRRFVVSASKAGDVGIPQVIRHDEDDIGPRGTLGGLRTIGGNYENKKRK